MSDEKSDKGNSGGPGVAQPADEKVTKRNVGGPGVPAGPGYQRVTTDDNENGADEDD